MFFSISALSEFSILQKVSMTPASQLSKGLGPLLIEKKFKSPQFCNSQLSVCFPFTAVKIILTENLSMKISINNAINPAVGFLPY